MFDRFTAIWGIKWTNKIDGIEKSAKEVWGDAIAGMPQKKIDAAIKKSARELIWPPEIAEFIKFCDEVKIDTVGINRAQAMELAEKKLRKRFFAKNYDEILAERKATVFLGAKIYHDQNDSADLLFCNADNCWAFKIADNEVQWLCSKHDE